MRRQPARRRILALSAALAAGSLSGCTDGLAPGTGTGNGPGSGDLDPGNDDREPGTAPDVDEETLAELVARTNAFAFDLFERLRADSPEQNGFSSPVSVSMALAMAFAGARGDTRSEMADALGFTIGEPDLHAAFADLQHRLNERSERVDADSSPGGSYDEDDDPVPFQLDIVNAVWGQADYPFEQAYLDVLADYYGGGLREVDYRSDPDAARETINAWVAERTNDRIDDLLPEGALTELTRLVLTNAVYFLANWEHPFEEAATETATFTSLDGTTHDVPLMSQDRSIPYAEHDGARAVDLPYLGEETSMLVVLPPAGAFEAYEESFDDATLAAIVDELDFREGRVRIPRFEFESGFSLREALQGLGMVDAFDEQAADFNGMADLEAAGENLHVSDVFHDTFVAVDEEGTEAAAATGVVIDADSAPMDPFEFVADRPFLFVIRDRPTETVLFVGRVVDPAGWA